MKNTNINDKLLIGARNITTTKTVERKRKMNIITIDNTAKENKVLTYKLTRSPETQKMSSLNDQRIDIIHYCIYEDEKPDRNGEMKKSTILTLMTRQGEIFGTNSATMREEFMNLVEIFGEDLEREDGYIPVRVFKAMSKNNREFVTCTYAD